MTKIVRTPIYNYNFSEQTGYFERWGLSINDDPQYSPIGLEILDMEVSTICNNGCKFCYKSNTNNGKNMSFETFKNIVDKIPTLTQIAVGIGDINSNLDLFKMFQYCRDNRIVPNITINGYGLTDILAQRLVDLCGAVAVSHYSDNVCYDAVHRLTLLGLKQVNIHQLLAEETFSSILNLLNCCKTDERLSKLNAIVFLSLKQKGRGQDYTRITDEHFRFIVRYCMEHNISFGFDSCKANSFLQCIKQNHINVYKKILEMAEPCESGLFSFYINVDGMGFPCSFAENINDWKNGIDILNIKDFLSDVWYSEKIKKWRINLLDNYRNCPIYKI